MPEGRPSALHRDPMGEGKRNATSFRDDICVYSVCALTSRQTYLAVYVFIQSTPIWVTKVFS